MTNRQDWQSRAGRKWAEEWRRTDRSFGGLTDRLLKRASNPPFERALDIGCGAGEISLALARGHSDADIRGIDVSAELIEVARARGTKLANLAFEQADAAVWRDPGFAPDLLVSRHGVMFFDSPVDAFAHLASIAAPSARLVFSCFRDRAENMWAAGVTDLLPGGEGEPADPVAPGPFAFADRGRVAAILAAGGWADIAFEDLDYAYVAGTGPDPVEDAVAYFLAIGPAAREAAALPAGERAAFVERLRAFLKSRRDGELVAFNAAAWIVTARRR